MTSKGGCAPDSTQSPNDFETSLPENCVEYFLFLVEEPSLDRRRKISKLEELRKSALRFSKGVLADYIWQKDEFNLELRDDLSLPPHLHGITEYGDSVEDEWLMVYLLRELSRSDTNLWVRVSDSDGEFLLIEAAGVLPRWLSPETDHNRTWLHQGKLYIVPPGKGADSELRRLSLSDALSVIEASPGTLVHSDLVEAEAFYRLEKYPGHIASSLHHAVVTIPRKLAFVLHERPKAVAPAVEAFYLRDDASLRPFCSSPSTTQLHFPPQDFVSVSVRFTRVLFSQILSQRFDPPPAWAEFLAKEPTPEARHRLEMGMKLTCGFELMVHRLDKTDSRVVREVGIILDDIKEEGEVNILPGDQDIKAWKDSTRQDDESWLDIDYRDLERELEGKAKGGPGTEGGFGDVRTQADLRKLVSRFETFLNDESAGVEGAELSDMDVETDSEGDGTDDDEYEDEYEDKLVSFDEEAFARMMKEMMGLPVEVETASQGTTAANKSSVSASNSTQHLNGADSTCTDEDDIGKLASQFEAELNENGALKLDPIPQQGAMLRGKESPLRTSAMESGETEHSDDEGEIDIDYNLAKNLLESFKGQAGMAGPAGNMLGMMGIRLPRDEDSSEDGRDTSG
ncbi:SGT1-domain-containing protein [Sodiomyces alkalinus F11]|uniref:SGT1-domain-containing protein n=1 Tax=Sodiomyces alkalinus (strain CBS 110278 / VKM F-3762 / F11) TaxID=1314773 RepID=A0A3N2Q7L9_SODAK|nr:SGT1-domain-containing protein [Sodiomyces alkalinus F11]ROT42706.1 SGT1-domain-containing protein [Sodiomyces alkalinus F11]